MSTLTAVNTVEASQPILHRAVTVFRPNYPARGYGAEEILATLMQVLDEENAHMILTLDEFDSLIEKEGSDAVYKLTRLQEMRQGKPQRLSFIFIMRDLKAIEQLDESAKKHSATQHHTFGTLWQTAAC